MKGMPLPKGDNQQKVKTGWGRLKINDDPLGLFGPNQGFGVSDKNMLNFFF